MKCKVMLTMALAVIMVMIAGTAMAAYDQKTVGDIYAKVAFLCGDEDGTAHSPDVTISKIEVTNSDVNSINVQVTFGTSCAKDSGHNLGPAIFPVTLKRTDCTARESNSTNSRRRRLNPPARRAAMRSVSAKYAVNLSRRIRSRRAGIIMGSGTITVMARIPPPVQEGAAGIRERRNAARLHMRCPERRRKRSASALCADTGRTMKP